MSIGHFLGGVAALIWDPADGRYLALRRSASKDFGRGDWECVTGRVDQGESYAQAVRREAREEIGAEIQIEFIVALTHFYRGAAVPENELLGVIFGCTLAEGQTAAMLGDEHSEMRWAAPGELDALLPEQHWMGEAIRRAERLRRLLPEELRQAMRDEGLQM